MDEKNRASITRQVENLMDNDPKRLQNIVTGYFKRSDEKGNREYQVLRHVGETLANVFKENYGPLGDGENVTVTYDIANSQIRLNYVTSNFVEVIDAVTYEMKHRRNIDKREISRSYQKMVTAQSFQPEGFIPRTGDMKQYNGASGSDMH